MNAPQTGWARRHPAVVVAALALLALAIDAGYQVYAARIQSRNADTATKVAQVSAGQCGTTKLLYVILNALAADSSPRFGSPPDGPVIPGARALLIGQLTAAERASVAGLRRQGCDVRPALP